MRLALCAVVLLAWVGGHAQTSTPPDDQQTRILSLESAWNQAVQQKDMKALDLLLDDELVDIDYDGSLMTKLQYMANISDPKIRFDRVVSDSIQVRVFGKSAVAVGVYREKGTKDGRPYLHLERFVDTWINRNGAWRCVASQSTLIPH